MKDIVQRIRESFGKVPRPSQTMSDAEVADDWGDEASRFPEHDKVWWEIPDDYIDRYSAVFCYLPPEAKLYYLPAYMSWFIRTGRFGDRDDNTFSNSVVALTIFLQDSQRLEPVWNLMTDDQKRVTLDFADACPSLTIDELMQAICKKVPKIVRSMKKQNCPNKLQEDTP